VWFFFNVPFVKEQRMTFVRNDVKYERALSTDITECVCVCVCEREGVRVV